MRREGHNFLLCWLFHLAPPRAAHFVDPNWSRLDYLPLDSNLNSLFFSNSKILRFWAWRHSRPRYISYLGVLLWHLRMSHPPRARVNTCTQLTHALTNPCTKRKVLSLTKPKGKIYKTKDDNIKKSLRNYFTCCVRINLCMYTVYVNVSVFFQNVSNSLENKNWDSLENKLKFLRE